MTCKISDVRTVSASDDDLPLRGVINRHFNLSPWPLALTYTQTLMHLDATHCGLSIATQVRATDTVWLAVCEEECRIRTASKLPRLQLHDAGEALHTSSRNSTH